jgi:hypothetical protein
LYDGRRKNMNKKTLERTINRYGLRLLDICTNVPMDWHSWGGGGGDDKSRRPGSITESKRMNLVVGERGRRRPNKRGIHDKETVHTNNMDKALASRNVSLNDLWHGVARIASSLLEDSISFTNSAAGLMIGHFDKFGTFEIFRSDHIIDGVKQKNVHQQLGIRHDSIQQISEFGKGVIRGRKDGPMTRAQSVFESSDLDGSTQSGKVIQTAGNVD